MKKLISVILTLTFVLTLLPTVMSVSAEDTSELNSKTAEELVNFVKSLRYTFGWQGRLSGKTEGGKMYLYPSRYSTETYLTLESENLVPNDTRRRIYNVLSFTFQGKTYEVNTSEKFLKMLGNYLTDEASDALFKQLCCFNSYYGEQHQYCMYQVGSNGEFQYIFNDDVSGSGPRKQLMYLENIKASGNDATASCIFFDSLTETLDYNPDSPTLYYSIPAAFKKGENGWRLDKAFVDIFESKNMENYRIDPPKNPSTGDSTAPLVLLAFASLLPLAWFGLRRKRAA